jgi:hypothetical protein
MADYYPLIAKAVFGLEKSTGEVRRALYDRARTALIAQLRGVEPALSEPEITRERLALEEAIRKVEAEAAGRSRSDPLPGRPESRQGPGQDSRPEGRPADSTRAMAPRPRFDMRTPHLTVTTPANNGDDQPDLEETRQAVPLSAASTRLTAEPRQAEERRARTPRGPASSDEASRGERPRLSLRDVVAEAESSGGATAEAAKNIRAYQAATKTEFERFEPRPDNRSEMRAEVRGEPRIESEPARPAARRGMEVRDTNRGRGAGPQRPSARRQGPALEEGETPAQDQDSDPDFDAAVRSEYRPPSSMVRQEDARAQMPSPSRAAGAKYAPESEDQPASARGVLHDPKKIAAMAIMAFLVLAVAISAYWKGGDIVAAFRGTSSPTTEQSTPAESSARGKIVERAPSALGPSERAMVAQKVVLYEEDQANPNGTQFVGSAVWRTERVAAAPGQKPDVIVRAEIEIPEQKVSLRWSLRRNDDKQLPASHTVEVVFTLPPDFPHGGISNIPGVLMKQGETTRGIPLNGVAVKVTTNFFLIGLSSVDADMQRNIQLLKERSWFDIPVVYGDGKRAIIAIEKGTPGERAFTDAFAAWGQ